MKTKILSCIALVALFTIVKVQFVMTFLSIDPTLYFAYITGQYSKTTIVNDPEFASHLIQAQPNVSQPLLVDCVVINNTNCLNVYGVVNFENLPMNSTFKRHTDYQLLVDNNIYKSGMPDHQDGHRTQVINFTVPYINDIIEKRERINLQVKDTRYNITYSVSPRILNNPPKKKKLAVCVYISDYNGINEVKSFLAYYKMVGVDNVIFYSPLELSETKSALSSDIESGFIRWYKFYWPLNTYRRHIQLSLQMAQVNSCYYRHRHEYEYIILLDLDEYLLSYSHPFDLYSSIVAHFDDQTDVLIVQANMFGPPVPMDREKVLREGTVFDNYTCWLDNKKTKREKMVVRTNSEGEYSNHKCFICKSRVLNMKDLRVFHLRAVIPEKIPKFCNSSHSYLSDQFRKFLKIFQVCSKTHNRSGF